MYAWGAALSRIELEKTQAQVLQKNKVKAHHNEAHVSMDIPHAHPFPLLKIEGNKTPNRHTNDLGFF